MTKCRCLMADDHPVVRRGIQSLLAEEKDIEVVGEAVNGREAAFDLFQKFKSELVAR